MNMDKWNNTSTEAFLAVRLGICILFIFLFSHLADAFVQSDLQMRAIEAIKNQQKSNNMQVL